MTYVTKPEQTEVTKCMHDVKIDLHIEFPVMLFSKKIRLLSLNLDGITYLCKEDSIPNTYSTLSLG